MKATFTTTQLQQAASECESDINRLCKLDSAGHDALFLQRDPVEWEGGRFEAAANEQTEYSAFQCAVMANNDLKALLMLRTIRCLPPKVFFDGSHSPAAWAMRLRQKDVLVAMQSKCVGRLGGGMLEEYYMYMPEPREQDITELLEKRDQMLWRGHGCRREIPGEDYKGHARAIRNRLMLRRFLVLAAAQARKRKTEKAFIGIPPELLEKVAEYGAVIAGGP